MPMFLGATSKVILANQSDRALRSIYERNENLICRALRVQSWEQFKSLVRTIRQAGHVVTDSEVAAERVGIAAPIARDGSVIAGISLVIASRETRGRRLEAFVLAVKAAAARINASLDATDVIASR